MKTQICKKCKVKKPLDCFEKAKSCRLGVRRVCRVCRTKYHKKQKLTPRGQEVNRKYKEKYRKVKLKRVHGPNAVELFNKFFAEQKGTCPGCKKHQAQLDKTLNLDHDHETLEYRGLLCASCNLRAGSSEKDIQILKNLVKYLENFYEGD